MDSFQFSDVELDSGIRIVHLLLTRLLVEAQASYLCAFACHTDQTFTLGSLQNTRV